MTLLERLLAQWGRPVTITGADGSMQTVRAILEPVSSRSQSAMDYVSVTQGMIPPGSFQYFGPAEPDVLEADRLEAGGRSYLVRRSECYYHGDSPAFRWALLIRGGDSHDGA